MADNKTLRDRFSDLIMQELKAEAKHNKRLADAMQNKNKSEKQCIDYVLEKVQDYGGVPNDEKIVEFAWTYYMDEKSEPKREHIASLPNPLPQGERDATANAEEECIKNVTTDEGVDDLEWDEIDDLDWD